MPVYLDDNGNPKTGVYLDDNGNEISSGLAVQNLVASHQVSSPLMPSHAPTKITPKPDKYDVKGLANMYKDWGVGALKSAGQTMKNIIPVGMMPNPLANVPDENLQASNFNQKVGGGLEQVGEMMVGGGAARQGAALLAEKLPAAAAKYVAPLLRVAGESANAATSASLHDENPKTAAAIGAAGGAAGEALAKVAPKLAESAIGARAKDRLFGRNPGATVLNETTGLSPAAVGSQAGAKASGLTNAIETMAANSTTPVSTQPALGILNSEIAKAQAKNSAPQIAKLQSIVDQLTQDVTTGQQMPTNLSASKLLQLKRGIGDLVTSWAPQERKTMNPVIKQVYHALDAELDATIPGFSELNNRITNLIPVSQRANAVANNASGTQRVMHRIAAHTGSLVGSYAGGKLGYEHGGVKGAVIGGTAGLVIPEMLASPSLRLMMARSASTVPATTPALEGAALQAVRDEQ